jgi:hypothetical protein
MVLVLRKHGLGLFLYSVMYSRLTMRYFEGQTGAKVQVDSQSTHMPAIPTDKNKRVYELRAVICLVNDTLSGRQSTVEAHSVALIKGWMKFHMSKCAC